MTEVVANEVAVGDEVRVYLHPLGTWKSFFEGVVSRVDVRTSQGRFFAVEVKHEVILDREHRTYPGFQDFVRYNCPNDFAGRIEILSTATQDVETEPALVQTSMASSEEAEPEQEQETHEPHPVELETHPEPEIVQAPEAGADVESVQVDVEPQPASKPRGLIGALFGRKR